MIKRFLNDKKFDKKGIKQGFKDCFEFYFDVIFIFRDVVRDYRVIRFIDVNVKVSSVMDFLIICEEGF